MKPKPKRKSFNAQATKRLDKATSALSAAMILSSDTSRTAAVAQYKCSVRIRTVKHVSATHSGEFSGLRIHGTQTLSSTIVVRKQRVANFARNTKMKKRKNTSFFVLSFVSGHDSLCL
jgi:Na+-transporting NADH:ubiquinone oxidoreductase subunit NqrC